MKKLDTIIHALEVAAPGRAAAAAPIAADSAEASKKLALSVGGKAVGSVASKPLAKAFAGVYCDRNAVCTLKPVEED